MMDLFSSFNPVTSTNTSMNWLMMITPMMIPMTPMWALKSKFIHMNQMIINKMYYQFKSSITKMNYPTLLPINSTLLLIATLNLMSLLPNTFSTTSHISMNLALALTMWLATTKKKFINKKKMMASLTPMNTPLMLIPFMVMIELVSLLIQPITLSVRLTANITAGHIMMILISKMYSISITSALVMNMMMMILELGVSMIQAYVFSLLIIMYNK